MYPFPFWQSEDGELTDMISFYTLPSTVMHHPTYNLLKAAYSFYNVSTRTPALDLMNDALIIAKMVSKFMEGDKVCVHIYLCVVFCISYQQYNRCYEKHWVCTWRKYIYMYIWWAEKVPVLENSKSRRYLATFHNDSNSSESAKTELVLWFLWRLYKHWKCRKNFLLATARKWAGKICSNRKEFLHWEKYATSFRR